MMADGIVQVRRMSQVDNERVLSVSHPDYGPSVAMEETRTLGRINRIVRTVEV
jgi:hypothetical protein